MKVINMHLDAAPFARIVSGDKNVEFRIFDEKRQQIQVGDTIKFVLRSDKVESCEKTVTAIKQFETFAAMMSAYPKESNNENMYEFYTKEDEASFGVVAFELA